LFSIGQSLEYQFGGCGLMIDGPRTTIKVGPAEQLSVSGTESDAAASTLAHWFASNELMFDSNFAIERVEQLPLAFHIEQVASRHCGFGSGTQLSMALILGAYKCLGLPSPSSKDLAIATGRGKRSAIGSHGFLQGGFLVDRGKKKGDALAPLELQLDFPTEWPIVTVLPANAKGLYGKSEASAFNNLPDSSASHREQMIDLVKHEMVNGIIGRDYARFAKSVYEFGHRCGSMFEAMQGGPYNGSQVAETVRLIQQLGVEAVGQSSWGPCVFAVLENQQQANQFVQRLAAAMPADTRIALRQADNRGALLSCQTIDISR
jgi:beta-RFAP synthase